MPAPEGLGRQRDGSPTNRRQRDNAAWGIGVDLISVWGSDLTWFYVGVGNDLVWSLDRNTLDVGVWGHAKSIIFRVGIEMDSTSALGSKLSWFYVGGRNWLRFSAGVKIDLVFENHLFLVWALKFTCIFCDGRNWLDLSAEDRTWLHFNVGMKIIWLCGWLNLTCFLYASRKSLVFMMSMKIDLVFGWMVQSDMNSVWGIELDIISM